MVLEGSRSSFGVFFKSITDEFDLTRAATSSISSLFMILCIFFTFAGGWALDKYGPRLVFSLMGFFTGLSLLLTSIGGSIFHIYLSYSVLFAIGTASFFTVINATVSKWFDKNRGIALGIANTGSRLGEATVAPVAAFLIRDLGWRNAYRIIGGVSWLIIIPLSRLMKRSPQDIESIAEGSKTNNIDQEKISKIEDLKPTGLTLSQALKTRNYWYFTPVWLFSGFGQALVFTHIVPYATDMNISPINAATILTIIGGISIPSGVLVGKIIDTYGAKIPLISFILLLGGVILSLTWARELWNFYLIAAFIGPSCSGMGVSMSTLTVEAFGKRRLGTIMSSYDAVFSVGFAIGAFAGGLVHDIYSNYNLAFLISAIGLAMSALLIVRFRPKLPPQYRA
ncbi:MAG: MFS transporter [Dehalococcoidia bacterium]|jgi:MFS family permease